MKNLFYLELLLLLLNPSWESLEDGVGNGEVEIERIEKYVVQDTES